MIPPPRFQHLLKQIRHIPFILFMKLYKKKHFLPRSIVYLFIMIVVAVVVGGSDDESGPGQPSFIGLKKKKKKPLRSKIKVLIDLNLL